MNGNGPDVEPEELDESMRKALASTRQFPAFVEAHLREVRGRADERAKTLEKEAEQDKPPKVDESEEVEAGESEEAEARQVDEG